MRHILWECEFCNEQFTTVPMDEPTCPSCQWEYIKEIGEVEIKQLAVRRYRG